MSRSRPCPPSSAQPASDEHAFPAKPAKRTLAVTSPGWDPVGDDDALYIQSDDTHRRASARAACIDQALLHARKRKRTAAAIDSSQPPSRPSTASQQSRSALKHDAEGCSNCRTKQSTCWYKKRNPDEKLCNPCSVHWNKNGYHRSVRPRAPKQPPAQPRAPAIIPTRSSSSRTRRTTCPSDYNNPGLSSPTASIAKLHSNLARNPRPSRSPSQLTLAAEREARIVKKSLAKAHAKSDALRLRKEPPKFAYISEEDDELYDNPRLSPPLPPPRPTKHSARRASRSISQKIDPTSVGRLSTRGDTFPPVAASSSRHPTAEAALYPGGPILGSFSNHHLSSDPPPAEQQELYVSPPEDAPAERPPAPPERRQKPRPAGGAGLAGAAHLIDTEASCLADFPPPGMPDKVFSPSRFLGASAKPLPPVAEPVKRADPSPPSAGPAGSPACSEGGMEHDGPGDDRGLSAAVVRGLHAGLGGAREPGRSDALATSSPPVLPPPSDCSEGITPLSADPASDEPDEALRVPPRTSTVGLSLRPVRRDAERAHHATRASIPPPSPSWPPEIIAALSQAISAGISADEIADVLRALDDPGPAPGPRQHAHPPEPARHSLRPLPSTTSRGEQPLGSLDPALAFLTAPDFFAPTSAPPPTAGPFAAPPPYLPPPFPAASTTTSAGPPPDQQPGLPLDCPLSVQDFERFFGFSPAHILDGAGPPA
ncbi:hypothetical protein PTTG_12462 [Puccinia triticina 1-1 BBBD Race 1]|uniref:GATA-type domain-containing protein n=1 Tax=Puccinia triticina (isolate 1-1 / race 1 (BBBD)) TaxID=630390 RepID=A0A180H1Y7_PUCT1|nr:hypothetical protein PTTG_12462 [Puccinia triticina 1-1 BBBD Race 1]